MVKHNHSKARDQKYSGKNDDAEARKHNADMGFDFDTDERVSSKQRKNQRKQKAFVAMARSVPIRRDPPRAMWEASQSHIESLDKHIKFLSQTINSMRATGSQTRSTEDSLIHIYFPKHYESREDPWNSQIPRCLCTVARVTKLPEFIYFCDIVSSFMSVHFPRLPGTHRLCYGCCNRLAYYVSAKDKSGLPIQRFCNPEVFHHLSGVSEMATRPDTRAQLFIPNYPFATSSAYYYNFENYYYAKLDEPSVQRMRQTQDGWWRLAPSWNQYTDPLLILSVSERIVQDSFAPKAYRVEAFHNLNKSGVKTDWYHLTDADDRSVPSSSSIAEIVPVNVDIEPIPLPSKLTRAEKRAAFKARMKK